MEQDIDYKGYKIKIRQSEFSESPDDWGNEDLFLVYDHRNFYIGRKTFEPKNIHDFLTTNDQELWKGHKYHNYWIFPVDAYIHSGVHLSLANTKDYPDRRWDVSTSGYILVERETWNNFDDAVEAAEGLIKEWNYYLSEEVYGFIIEKPKTTYSITKEKFDKLKFENDLATLESEFDIEDEWEEIDSCWGYYGEPEESGLLDEARSVIDYKTRNNE